MSEWKECKLSDVVASANTGLDAIRRAPIVEKETGLKCLRIQDISQNKPFVKWGNTEVKPDDYQRYQLRQNDIIMARTCSTGICTFIKNDLNAVFNNGLVRIRANIDRTFPDYLYYLFLSRDFIGHIDGISGGTSVQLNMQVGDLLSYDLMLPPLPEQCAIAGVLSSLDDKIDLLHRQNKTLQGIAEALWRKIFVEEVDPGWDEKGLDEIATFLNGLPCQKYPLDTSTGPLPVIKIKELRTGITDDSDLATSKVPPDYIIDDGDILFSWSGSLEVVIWSFGKGVLNQHLFKVTSVDYPKWFYYYWIKHHLAEFRDIAQDKATTMGHIQRHHLSAAKVLIPDEKSFEYLNKQIGPLFEKMVHNLKAIRKFARLRDTLLPKLMSGEVRVRI